MEYVDEDKEEKEEYSNAQILCLIKRGSVLWLKIVVYESSLRATYIIFLFANV